MKKGKKLPKPKKEKKSFLSSVYNKFSNVVNSDLFKKIIDNHSDLYVLLSHLSTKSYSQLILMFLKEIIRQMLGKKPSKGFPKFPKLPQVDKDNMMFYALQDLLNAKSIQQIMKVLIEEREQNEKGGHIYHALHHTLNHSLKAVHHHLEQQQEKGGSISKQTKNLLYYSLPVLGGLTAAYTLGLDPSSFVNSAPVVENSIGSLSPAQMNNLIEKYAHIITIEP